MSDFSELCPLFATGVFNEITFPNLHLLSGIAVGNNLLGGTGLATGAPCDFKFSRRVIVTNAYMRQFFTNSVDVTFLLGKRVGSGTAAPVAFGSYTATITLSADNPSGRYVGFTKLTATTLEAADVLNLGTGTLTVLGQGSWDLIVRYKEA
jgi:hypothetical protein